MSGPVDVLAVKLLRGFQSSFGPSRPDDDEEDAEVWDQIDAACEALAELIAALRTAERTITATLAARGYQPGACTDGWMQEVRDEVAALVPIRAALARVGGAK